MDQSLEQPNNHPLVEWLRLDNDQIRLDIQSLRDHEADLLMADVSQLIHEGIRLGNEGTPDEQSNFLKLYGIKDKEEFVELTKTTIPFLVKTLDEQIGKDRVDELHDRTKTNLEK